MPDSLAHLIAATEYSLREVGFLQSDLTSLAKKLQDALDVARGEFPWDRDISPFLATNDDCPGLLKTGWWQRSLDQIETVCFHHTNGWTSPEVFARWYVTKDGGRPSTCYSVWITDTGEVLLCNQLEVGCWHNHNGHKNVDLSVVLAGKRHIHPPSPAQEAAAARVAAWAIRSPILPLINDISYIKGHMDYKRPGFTECPGWSGDAGAGLWKPSLYGRIAALC